MAELLLADLPAGAHVLADKGYDADSIRIPPRIRAVRHTSCRDATATMVSPLPKAANSAQLIERCFNKLKQFRHIAMRFDRNPLNYLAMIKLASTRLWL